MTTRKFESDYSKLPFFKKKRRVEFFVEHKKGL